MIIIKIGGGKRINVEYIIQDLAKLDEKFLIVHGANSLRDEIMQKLNFEKKKLTSVSGFESVFSDKEMLDVLMMSYSGLKNKRIVETCQKNKINAVGLTGIDGNLIQGKRNLGIKVREKNKVLLKKDLSGKPKNINIGLIQLLMDNDYVPVITVPILDQNNIAINSENDDIVALISYQLKVSRVISLIEAPGLLEDASNENSLLKNLTKNQLTSRIEKSKGRIKRKLYSINKLFQQEIMKVHISDGRIENPIVTALEGGGTLIE